MPTAFKTIAEAILGASDYTDVFKTPDDVPQRYRWLAGYVHPDKHPAGTPDHQVATKVFSLLNGYRTEAQQMLAENRFGEPVLLATIRTKKHVHKVRTLIGTDEMASYYRTLTDEGNRTILKVATSARDNDLMAQEAKALKTLHSKVDKLTRHYPALLDTFIHSEGRKRANVFPDYEDYHSMQTVRGHFNGSLDPRHGVWMFRRLLMALGFAHEQGLVHGAVTPDNVLIGPRDHAVVLIDWCYSVVVDDKSKTNFIKAVVPMYKSFYAPEVLAKEPPSAATDLYMAAKLMTHMIPVAPKPLRAFFRGTALTKPSMRPQNAWGLLKEFDDLLEEIGEPFFPRRWVEFAVPTGTTSS